MLRAQTVGAIVVSICVLALSLPSSVVAQSTTTASASVTAAGTTSTSIAAAGSTSTSTLPQVAGCYSSQYDEVYPVGHRILRNATTCTDCNCASTGVLSCSVPVCNITTCDAGVPTPLLTKCCDECRSLITGSFLLANMTSWSPSQQRTLQSVLDDFLPFLSDEDISFPSNQFSGNNLLMTFSISAVPASVSHIMDAFQTAVSSGNFLTNLQMSPAFSTLSSVDDLSFDSETPKKKSSSPRMIAAVVTVIVSGVVVILAVVIYMRLQKAEKFHLSRGGASSRVPFDRLEGEGDDGQMEPDDMDGDFVVVHDNFTAGGSSGKGGGVGSASKRPYTDDFDDEDEDAVSADIASSSFDAYPRSRAPPPPPSTTSTSFGGLFRASNNRGVPPPPPTARDHDDDVSLNDLSNGL